MLTFREFCEICEVKRPNIPPHIEEQIPPMKPDFYNQQIARRQAAQKVAHSKHVHQELGAEARTQQAQKRSEIKAILSR